MKLAIVKATTTTTANCVKNWVKEEVCIRRKYHSIVNNKDIAPFNPIITM